MFYDIFARLCEEKGTSPAQVRRDLGISQSTMASWKSKGLTPNAATVARLAEYFNVSVDYLLGKEERPTPVFDRMSDDALQILNILDLSPEKQVQFNEAFAIFLKTQKIICEEVLENSINEKLRDSLASNEAFEKFFAALLLFSATTKTLEKINPEGIYQLRSKYKKRNSDMETFSKIYSKLTDEGRRKAIERVKEIAEIPRYQRKFSS